jgi:DNA uptake protein ComE-like DNA-binding protein
MRKLTAYLMAVGMVVAGLSGGCSLSSMENKVKDVTGRSDKTETRVELNTAGRKRLAKLPGLTGADADKIIANRPYENRRDLLRKGVLSEAEFEKIKDSTYVAQGKD